MKRGHPPKAPGHPGKVDPLKGCKFPLWPDESRFVYGESLFCGAPRVDDVSRPYCAYHERISAGPGTPSERSAVCAVKSLVKRGTIE